MNVTIKDRTIELKYGFRAHIIYENITGQTFAPKGATSIITFFYAVIMAAAKDMNLDLDEFIDILDEQPLMLIDFTNWVLDQIKRQEAIAPKRDSSDRDSSDRDSSKN